MKEKDNCMKRFFLCAPLVLVVCFLVLNSAVVLANLLKQQSVPAVMWVLELLMIVLLYLLFDLTIGLVSGGKRASAVAMLSKGQFIRLVAVSLPDEGDSDHIGILAEIKTGKIRYLVIHNPKKVLTLTPGHYYRYKEWGQLEPAPFGKL